MSRRSPLLVIALTVAATAVAHAQPVTDPIDALLQARPPPKDVDPEEPDTAAAGATVESEPARPASPPHAPPPTLTAPVYLDETGRNPDAPPTPADLAYDNRIRASMAAAQGFQGPLDGGWTLSAGGHERYVLQLVDRDGAVEGAWRDLGLKGDIRGSGLIERADRTGAEVTFRFAGGTSVAILHPTGEGRWTGQLIEAGHTDAASLRRRNP